MLFIFSVLTHLLYSAFIIYRYIEIRAVYGFLCCLFGIFFPILKKITNIEMRSKSYLFLFALWRLYQVQTYKW